MIWKYIDRDEIPEHGDFCFFVTHFGKSYHVGRYCLDDNAFLSDDKIIHQKEVFKWINIDEIHDSIECDNEGKYHDYEDSISQLYVSDIKFDQETLQYKFKLKPWGEFEIDYPISHEDEDNLWKAARSRKFITCEIRQGNSGIGVRNVKIVEE